MMYFGLGTISIFTPQPFEKAQTEMAIEFNNKDNLFLLYLALIVDFILLYYSGFFNSDLNILT